MNWIILALTTCIFDSTLATFVNQSLYSEFTLQNNDYALTEFEDTLETTRILGGEVASRNQFPFLVGIVVWLIEKRGWCGGSIISDQYVITAAHCLDDPPSVSVIFGANDRANGSEEGRFRREVTKEHFIVHELWNPLTLDSDIALIYMDPKIKLTAKIQPIALPFGEYEAEFFDNYLATTGGWGRFQRPCKKLSQHLRYFESRILHNIECQKFYPKYIVLNHICLDGGKGRMGCAGDSGGPLVVELDDKTPLLIGVLSFAKCCRSRHPTAFTRITQYLSWISKHTNSTNSTSESRTPVYL